MTSPLLLAAAHAWLDRNRTRAHVGNPVVTAAALAYILDTQETR